MIFFFEKWAFRHVNQIQFIIQNIVELKKFKIENITKIMIEKKNENHEKLVGS